MKTEKISENTNKMKRVRYRNQSRRISMRSLTHRAKDARFGCDDSRDIVQKVIKTRRRGYQVRFDL